MVFSSPIFLFYYLPVVLAVYLALFLPSQRVSRPDLRLRLVKLSNAFLLVMGLHFYFWGEGWMVLVMLATALTDFLCALWIEGARSPASRRLGLVTSLVGNLGTLAFFKYLNFAVANWNALVEILNLKSMALLGLQPIALPMGISFYTFQSLSYTVDVYRGQVAATRSFADFACYVTLFPQLIAGPIVRYRDVAAELIAREVNLDRFASGSRRFIVGLGKKVLIANTLALPADRIFEVPAEHLTLGLSWLGLSCYTLQIYFDFSGYSDMAIGMGRMLGFHFLENFDHPYVSRSVQEFWRRWHISLSSWFRDYLYIPLGGSRGSPARTYTNLCLVFLLCGFWHGASWTFIFWGLYHGAFLCLERLGLGTRLAARAIPIQHLYTMLVVMGGWVLFRADSLSHAARMFGALAGLGSGQGAVHPVGLYLTRDVQVALIIGAIFSAPVAGALLRWQDSWVRSQRHSACGTIAELGVGMSRLAALAFILLLSSIATASGTYNPFIYYRF